MEVGFPREGLACAAEKFAAGKVENGLCCTATPKCAGLARRASAKVASRLTISNDVVFAFCSWCGHGMNAYVVCGHRLCSAHREQRAVSLLIEFRVLSILAR